MSKIYYEDSYSIGLLLINNATNGMRSMARKETLEQYYNCVNKNLIEMGEHDIYTGTIIYDEPIYTVNVDESGTVFYILKRNIDLEKAQSEYLGIVPLNYVIASEKENALKILGLELVNGVLRTIKSTSIDLAKKAVEEKLNISYEDFDKLDFDEQQKLISEHRRITGSKKADTTVMVGSGENAVFMQTKKGSIQMLDDGTFYEAGLSLEEEQRRLDDRNDEMLYSKPVAFVKKLVRRIKDK